MKRIVAAFAVLALLSAPLALAQEKKAEPAKAACCAPACKMEAGKCVTHEKKLCTKDCDKPCCKPVKKEEKKPA